MQGGEALTGATHLESLKTLRKANAVHDTQSIDFSYGGNEAYMYLAIAYGLIWHHTYCPEGYTLSYASCLFGNYSRSRLSVSLS